MINFKENETIEDELEEEYDYLNEESIEEETASEYEEQENDYCD